MTLPLPFHFAPALHGAAAKSVSGLASLGEAVFFCKIVIDDLAQPVNAGIASEVRQ